MASIADAFREVDVCVLGGGPAGSTISTRLRALGLSVCLVEPKNTRKTHLVATLPPQILSMLECIGARDRVEHASFLDASQTWLWWTSRAPEMREHAGAFHVERSRFSQILRETAREAGVSVLHPRCVSPPRRVKDAWEVSTQTEGTENCIRASFLVDATGTANPLRERRIGGAPPLLVLVGTWQIDPHASFQARIEACDDEWFWAAPATPGVVVAAVFLDPKRLRGSTNLTNEYGERLRAFRLFAEYYQPEFLREVRACDAGFRRAEHLCGPDFIKVGDAAVTLDPLSSQGVLCAVSSGLQAAAVVNTLLRKPPHAGDAIAFYTTRQLERLNQHLTKASGYYRERARISPTPFWLDRMGDELRAQPRVPPFPDLYTPVALAPDVSIEDCPVLSGDVIITSKAVRFGDPAEWAAFLGGKEAAPLLEKLRVAHTMKDLLHAWKMGEEQGLTFLKWFWERRIITAKE